MGGNTMNLTLRLGTPDDADRCGTISYEAFKAIAEHHHFPPDSPSPQGAVANFARRLSHPGYYVVVAELEGRIVGSNVLDERSTIAGVGPTTVDPTVQKRMIGHQLMQAVLQRVAERHCPGLRLVQATYHSRSLCLYTKLGFDVRELLVNLQGPPLTLRIPGYAVRPATEGDRNDAMRCVVASMAMTAVENSWRPSRVAQRALSSTRTVSPAMPPSSGSQATPSAKATP